MASKRRNMFHKNKKTTEIVTRENNKLSPIGGGRKLLRGGNFEVHFARLETQATSGAESSEEHMQDSKTLRKILDTRATNDRYGILLEAIRLILGKMAIIQNWFGARDDRPRHGGKVEHLLLRQTGDMEDEIKYEYDGEAMEIGGIKPHQVQKDKRDTPRIRCLYFPYSNMRECRQWVASANKPTAPLQYMQWSIWKPNSEQETTAQPADNDGVAQGKLVWPTRGSHKVNTRRGIQHGHSKSRDRIFNRAVTNVATLMLGTDVDEIQYMLRGHLGLSSARWSVALTLRADKLRTRDDRPRCVRYLGLYIDKRVTWNPHTRLKRIDLNRKFGLLRNLLHRTSILSLGNKLTIYNTILKPTWTYGMELWGSARKSYIDRIQSLQSKTLRTILDVPCGIVWVAARFTTAISTPPLKMAVAETGSNQRPQIKRRQSIDFMNCVNTSIKCSIRLFVPFKSRVTTPGPRGAPSPVPKPV
ncbi:hypothetical protein AAG570_006161 [Ranatra chinensis]|uniref:Uncharacterized protein n=1 Tax=Ranatra chinensis TaxID=642074 RepID=A0ABD0XY99_9HEMI